MHLAIAVDTPRGLLVPVITNADDLNIAGLAKQIADLAARTRDNKVGPTSCPAARSRSPTSAASGALFDTPIINQPQVAILGTGAITKEPKVVAGPEGEDVDRDPLGVLPAADLRPPPRRRGRRGPVRVGDPGAAGGGRVRGRPGPRRGASATVVRR